MNKQSLKYILYALLALLIIISLFNCFKKESIEEFRRRRRGNRNSKRGAFSCPRGQESREDKRNRCTKCSRGFYKNVNGTGRCKKCPDDKPLTMQNGAPDIAFCMPHCGSRRYLNRETSTCKDCPDNTSNKKNTVGKACSLCPENTEHTKNFVINDDGTFAPDWEQCQPCSNGFIRPTHTIDGKPNDGGRCEPNYNDNIDDGDEVIKSGFYKHLNVTKSKNCGYQQLFFNNQNPDGICNETCSNKLQAMPYNEQMYNDWVAAGYDNWIKTEHEGNTPEIIKTKCKGKFDYLKMIKKSWG